MDKTFDKPMQIVEGYKWRHCIRRNFASSIGQNYTIWIFIKVL